MKIFLSIDKNISCYKTVDYHLVGQLVKIKYPGMLIVNEQSFYNKNRCREDSSQIFDLGGKNIYLLVEINTWKPAHRDSDSFIMARFLLGSNIFVWRGIKVPSDSIKDALDSRIEPV